MLGTGCIFSRNLFCSRNERLVNQLICGAPGKEGVRVGSLICHCHGGRPRSNFHKNKEAKHTQARNLATQNTLMEIVTIAFCNAYPITFIGKIP